MTKKIQPTKECRVCGNVFSKPSRKSFKAWSNIHCCSKVCGATHKNHKGSYDKLAKTCQNPQCKQVFIKSKKDTHQHFAKQDYCSISCSKIGKYKGEQSGTWLGNDVGYSGVHKWMNQTYGRPQFCEHCKTSARRMYHWANISQEYKRDRVDWYRLCVPCHKKLDLSK